jgi:CheY-like chemotaxis protein
MINAAPNFRQRPNPMAWFGFYVVVRFRVACRLLFLLGALFVSGASQAADTYGALLDKRFDSSPKATTNAPPLESSANPSAPSVAALEQALKNRTLKIEMGPPPPPPPNVNRGLAITIASGIFALILLKSLFIIRRFNAKRAAAALDREQEELKRVGKEPTVVSLFQELKHGLNPTVAGAVPEAHLAVFSTEALKTKESAVAQVFESAPVLFSQLKKRFAEISRTTDVPTRLKMLHEFSQEIRPSKTAARIPALRSHRLLALALEGLLKQLSARAQNLTSWRMRLAADTLDLLEDLCAPNLTPDLAIRPPIKLLVVDDCAVNRRSMVFALRKVFHEPDLAADGEPALALAAKNAYDVIFLDIEMPGMNGFELCEKIRETKLNKNTPIVFVTSHDNFESRAKLVTKGAQDLIGKPYLPAEITLKALELSLQGRLKNSPAEAAAGPISNEPAAESKLPVLSEVTAAV